MRVRGIQVGPTHNIGQIGALLPAGPPMRDADRGPELPVVCLNQISLSGPGWSSAPTANDEIKRRVVDVEQFLAAVEKFVARSDDNDESSTLGRHR